MPSIEVSSVIISAEPAPEQPAAEVSQSAPAEAPVASSGYRSRRQAQNSYGDEQATPAPAAPAESYQPAPVSLDHHQKHSEEYSFHNISRWALDTELQKCDLPKPDIVIVYKLNVDKVIELLHNEAKELDHLEKSNEYLKLQYNNIMSLEKDSVLCDL